MTTWFLSSDCSNLGRPPAHQTSGLGDSWPAVSLQQVPKILLFHPCLLSASRDPSSLRSCPLTALSAGNAFPEWRAHCSASPKHCFPGASVPSGAEQIQAHKMDGDLCQRAGQGDRSRMGGGGGDGGLSEEILSLEYTGRRKALGGM